MEVLVFDWWWTSHQSSAHKVSAFSDSVLCFGKMNENPRSNIAWKQRLEWFKVHRNTEPWTELMVSQWNSSGISSQDAIRCSSVKKFKSNCWDWMKHQRILKEGSYSCRCSTTSHEDQKTMKKNAIQMLNSCLYLPEDSEQDNGHFSVLVQRKSGILSVKIAHKVNGQNGRKDDGDTRRKRTPRLPSHESIVQRSAQEQRRWKIVNPLLCRPGNDYNCFSHNYFCKSAQSLRCSRRNVWRIWILSRGETRCGRTVEFLVRAKCDQHQTWFWTMLIPHIKGYYCKDMENELKSYHKKTTWANFVRMQDSWMLLKSDSISLRKILQNSHNSQIQCPVVSTLCQETKIHLNRKVGSEWTPKLDPYWKLQPVACTANMELRSESCLWTKTILTHGSEFIMAWTSWSRTWTTMSRKLQKCSSKNMR